MSVSSPSTQASWLPSEDLTALMFSTTPSHFWLSEQKVGGNPAGLHCWPLDVLRDPQAWFQSEDALLTLPTTLVPAWGSQSHDFKHLLPLDIYLLILVNKG